MFPLPAWRGKHSFPPTLALLVRWRGDGKSTSCVFLRQPHELLPSWRQRTRDRSTTPSSLFEDRYDVMKNPIEDELRIPSQGYVIGCDEVGRGPLAGPVTAAAVALPLHFVAPAEVDDSKKLTPKKRASLNHYIRETIARSQETSTHPGAFAIVDLEASVIDEMNILQASLHAMRQAAESVVEQMASLAVKMKLHLVLIDGHKTLPDCVYPQRAVIKGDQKSLHIACASILAKEHRDALMVAYHDQYPLYGFDRHKGYPTKAHREAIARHGICPLHRRTFNMK